MVGGCCGTTTDHIKAVDAMLREVAEDGFRPEPKARTVETTPQLASLFSAVPLRQENAYLSIGERCNANGSKKFRELQEAVDWDGCVAMGRDQQREGAHTLDLCTAFVGRDEVADMTAVTTLMRGQVDAPLVFDSTEYPVLEAAFELYGGKGVLELDQFRGRRGGGRQAHGAGQEARCRGHRAHHRRSRHGEDRRRQAPRSRRRLVDFACGRYGLPQSDLLLDPLTFTICTGNEDDRKLGLWTLEAIERIRDEFPEIQIILGLSNISFGLNAAARHVLNSVMLDHAQRRGLTGAIVHSSKIMPLHRIPPEEVQAAEDLIFDNWRDEQGPAAGLHGAVRRPQGRGVEEEGAAGEGRRAAGAAHRRRRQGGPRGRPRARHGSLRAADDHQRAPALGHEGGGRAVRCRQDAAALRAAVGRDDEEVGGLSRALHGEGRGPGEGDDRARHGEGRRPRHRQEPGRHHPHQ